MALQIKKTLSLPRFRLLVAAIFAGSLLVLLFHSQQFINLPGLLIVALGTPLAVLLCQPPSEVRRVFLSVISLYKRHTDFGYGEINQILTIADHFRRGFLRLAEQEVSHINNDFFRSGMQQVIDGESLAEIHKLLDLHKEIIKARETADLEILRTVANFALGFGVIGTLLTLIYALQAMPSTELNSLSNAIGFALLASLYGLIIAQLIVKPLIIKKQLYVAKLMSRLAMHTEAVTLIYHRQHPTLIKDMLDAFTATGFERTIKMERDLFIRANSA